MKFKRFLSLMLAMAMVFSLAACGGGKKEEAKPAETAPAETKPEEPAEKPAEEKPAETGGTLEVYVSHKEDVYGPIVKEFQERYGIQVNVVAAGTGELLKRVEAESANPMGDIMFGGGAESLEAYTDYFEPYETTEAGQINPNLKSSDNSWTPFSSLPIVIMYNDKLVAEDEVPTGWADLLDPKWKGQIAFTDPALSGSCFTAMVTMIKAEANEEAGWEFIRKFVENLDGKLLKSSSDIFKGVADGEFSLGVTLEESAHKYILADADVGMVYPAEGTSIVPDGTAIIKGAKNMDNAKLFIDFVSGPDIQKMLVVDMSRRSVRDDIEPTEGLPKLAEIKVVDYNIAEVSKEKETIMSQWKDILVGK